MAARPPFSIAFPGVRSVPTAISITTDVNKADMIDGLRKGLEVICAFDDGTPKLTQSELAQRLDLSRASARRYLMTLTALGYMATDGKAFWLTPKVMRLGHSYVASARLPRTVAPVLQKLTAALGESTNLAVLEGYETVYVSRANAAKLLSTGLEPGTRLPAQTVAAGRLLLSFLSDAALDRWLDGVNLTAYTAQTTLDRAVIKKDIIKIRKLGYGLSESQFELGLRGIAVPLLDGSGAPVGAIGVSMSSATLSASVAVKRFVPAMQEAADELRALL